MKLRKLNYIDPKTKGEYPEMFVEERIEILDGREKYLSIGFKMYFIKDGKKEVIAESFMPFQGGDGDEFSTNETAYVIMPDGTRTEMLPVLYANGGALPEGVIIDEIGYPHFDDVQGYFTGGSIASPEINVTNPLSQLFIRRKCVINGDTLENQGFEFVE